MLICHFYCAIAYSLLAFNIDVHCWLLHHIHSNIWHDIILSFVVLSISINKNKRPLKFSTLSCNLVQKPRLGCSSRVKEWAYLNFEKGLGTRKSSLHPKKCQKALVLNVFKKPSATFPSIISIYTTWVWILPLNFSDLSQVNQGSLPINTKITP